MLREAAPIIVFLVAVSCVVAGLSLWLPSRGVQESPAGGESPLNVLLLGFTADRENYRSNENMVLTVTLNCSRAAENAKIHIWGLRNLQGRYWIDENRSENLLAENNELTFPFKMPTCSHCAGFEEGFYEIYVEALADNRVLDNATTSVHLAQ